jgi:hypothetical protein
MRRVLILVPNIIGYVYHQELLTNAFGVSVAILQAFGFELIPQPSENLVS